MPAIALDTIKTVPLEKDEYDTLRYIYVKRLRLLFFMLMGIIVLEVQAACYFMFYAPDYKKYLRYDVEDIQWKSFTGEYFFLFCFFMFFVLISIPIFFRRVYPFRKDYECGSKELVPYTVIRKEYFPASDQYFIYFDDARYNYHQVDADFYAQCGEGTVVDICMGIHSKYIFEKDGRFKVI